jgi:hypothetical protein
MFEIQNININKSTHVVPIKDIDENTRGPHLVRILGPGKNRTKRNSY